MGAEEGDVVGELGGDRAAAALVVDVEPVAGLDLEVVMPARARLGAAAPRASARSSSSLAARVAVGRDADAAGVVRRAGHPGGELVGAVAGEHEVGVAVDEARDHAAPGGVDALVGGRARRARRAATRAVLDHERRVAHEPERALAERSGRW